jgi:hypothetical protein
MKQKIKLNEFRCDEYECHKKIMAFLDFFSLAVLERMAYNIHLNGDDFSDDEVRAIIFDRLHQIQKEGAAPEEYLSKLFNWVGSDGGLAYWKKWNNSWTASLKKEEEAIEEEGFGELFFVTGEEEDGPAQHECNYDFTLSNEQFSAFVRFIKREGLEQRIMDILGGHTDSAIIKPIEELVYNQLNPDINAKDIMKALFVWDDTKERHAFWKNISNEWERCSNDTDFRK